MQAGLRIDEQAATEVIEHLQARGLIAIAGDELRPTAEGVAMHGRLNADIQSHTQQMYAGLDAADLAAAYRVLSTLTERASALLAS